MRSGYRLGYTTGHALPSRKAEATRNGRYQRTARALEGYGPLDRLAPAARDEKSHISNCA